jgi:hypothetical protein
MTLPSRGSDQTPGRFACRQHFPADRANQSITVRRRRYDRAKSLLPPRYFRSH